MNAGMIATRYARALYGTAQKQNDDQKIYSVAGELIEILQNSDELKRVLQKPVLSNKQKKEYFYSVVGEKSIPALSSFIEVVFENNRQDILQLIFLKYCDLYRIDRKILSGRLITASEINPKTTSKLIGFLESVTNGTLEMEKQINPDIIGGFILEVDHQRWDASVSGQLKMMRNKFTEQNRKTI
jgi:F-type H+-transporting ATPase subunit delta